ncbi:MAG: hypothetical protein HYV14_14845 [Elusimicrobia bacterium]|nr:hypothetical protein [Elusimicrobiota bacterium]
MKTPNPLAAALLLIAASAAAQPFSAGAGTGFTMPAGNSSPFLLAPGAGPIDEMVFKCGTVPYVACTAAQLNLREAVRTSGKCPQPAIPSCVDYLMRNAGTAPIQLLGNQANPSTANDEFFKKCGTVPYRLCTSEEEAQKAAWEKEQAKRAAESGLPYDKQPGFIGPPAPPINASNSVGMFSDPPAFSPAEFQKEMADARSDNPYPVIDLGDNRYGIVTPDGEVQVCGKGLCAGTRAPGEIPDFHDKVQMARAESAGFTGSSGGGQAGRNAPATPGINNAGQTGSPNQAADQTNPSDEAKGMGRQAAADSAAVSGASGSPSGTGGSIASNGSSSGGATAEQVIKTKAASLGSIEITYTRLQKTEDDIKGAAGAFSSGQMTGFASPNAPSASGRLAEPPVDEKYLGKIQASSNE